jgi:hypothetical protein
MRSQVLAALVENARAQPLLTQAELVKVETLYRKHLPTGAGAPASPDAAERCRSVEEEAIRVRAPRWCECVRPCAVLLRCFIATRL